MSDGGKTAETAEMDSCCDEDEEDMYSYSLSDSDTEDEMNDFVGPGEQALTFNEKKVEVIKLADLKERYAKEVGMVCDTLGLTSEMSMQALKYFKWDIVTLNERWFDDQEKIESEIGLTHNSALDRGNADDKLQCPVCLMGHKRKNMLSAGCEHWVCVGCWRAYLEANLDNKDKAARLPCPVSCKTIVPRKLLEEIASTEQMAKLREHDSSLMVECNPRVSWCTRPNCDFVSIVPTVPRPDEPVDVKCTCGEAYCFTCKQEAHRPVDCHTVKQWAQKNSAESENLTWIIANTKPCPKCQRPIEKDKGCMHMTCSQCRHEFCWLCLGDWAKHSDQTGGYYACNKYEQGRQRGEFTAEEMQRKHARESLERYTHYYERYHAHDLARRAAVTQLGELSEQLLQRLSEVTGTPRMQLKFVSEAHQQVVECRRVLKWTYAYGYYKFDEIALRPQPDGSTAWNEQSKAELLALRNQKSFFEFLQNDAESSLEPLTLLLEKRLPIFFNETEFWKDARKSPDEVGQPREFISERFSVVQQELINRTQMAKGFFEKLVLQLEQGLESSPL